MHTDYKATAPFIMPPYLQHTPPPRLSRVFTSDLQQRLETVNRAARVLREMGYRIVWERFAQTYCAYPMIKIDRTPQPSLGLLLSHAKGHTWRKEGGRLQGFTEFMDVTITWEEAECNERKF